MAGPVTAPTRTAPPPPLPPALISALMLNISRRMVWRGAARRGPISVGSIPPWAGAEQGRADLRLGLGQHARGGGLGHADRLGRQLQLAVFGDLLDQPQLRGLQHQAGWRLGHIAFVMQGRKISFYQHVALWLDRNHARAGGCRPRQQPPTARRSRHEQSHPAPWPRKLRSQHWYGGNSRDTIYHRGWLKNQGYPHDLFDGRPVIGIMNTWADLTPCNGHLRELAEKVKAGVWEAGGFPVEVPVFSASGNTFRPTAMMYRNLAAMAVGKPCAASPSTAPC